MKGVYKPKQREFKKVWGAETWLCNTDLYCGKILHLDKGYRCSIHFHAIKDETFYILYGKVLMEHNGREHIMVGGDAIRIRTGEKHRFTGLEYSAILEISTKHYEDDSYRITQSERCSWWRKYLVDKWRDVKGKDTK